MPEISVIVPVYKAERYLRGCVDSILNQSFSDLEVILVDDGSPDGSGGICDEYAGRDSRVRVVHQENQGQSAARNRAMDMARGSWLCFVDSDDAIHPQMLQRLYQAALDTGAAMSMCRMWEAPRMPEGFLQSPSGTCRVLEMDEETLVDCLDRGEYPGWVACAKLVRREVARGKPFTPGRVYEDNEAVCHWLLAAGRLARIPDALYYYRTNPDSTTQGGFSLKRLDYLWALEQILLTYQQRGFLTLRDRFWDLYVREAVGFYCRAKYDLNRPDIARQIKKSVKRCRREHRLPMTKERFELLLDAAHPKLIRLYWPLEGAVRTLRQQGPGGLWKKLRKLGRGDTP